MRQFLATLVSIALFVAATFLAVGQTITTFDVPGAISTIPMSINGSGEVGGVFTDATHVGGFLRAPDGSFMTFGPPPKSGTSLDFVRINGAATVAGEYFDFAGDNKAFVRYKNRAFTTIAFPAQVGAFDSRATAINALGMVTGFVEVFSPASLQGFVWMKGATATIFQFPGGASVSPSGINRQGMVTGSYGDAIGTHGFLKDANGSFSTFDPASSTVTNPMAINDSGIIAGDFSDHGRWHGFVRDAVGAITAFDPPKSTMTMVSSMNEAGAVVGFFRLAGKMPPTDHSFIRFPDGNMVTFAVPGATLTDAQSINGYDVVTGYYSGADNVMHGFLRQPKQ